jgi:hypothetical protein
MAAILPPVAMGSTRGREEISPVLGRSDKDRELALKRHVDGPARLGTSPRFLRTASIWKCPLAVQSPAALIVLMDG